MKKTFIFALLLLLAGPLFAQSRLEDVKRQVIDLSLKNTTNESNQPKIREQLRLLTSELVALAGPVNEERWIQYSPGSWRQIWSDEADNTGAGAPKRDLSQIYQIISEQGWGFNFGVRQISENNNVTFALAVVASVSGNVQTTEITNAYSRSGGLEDTTDLLALAEGIRNKENTGFVERDAGRFPRGPIGAKGELTILFLDQDLKIGTAPNVYTGVVEMFVLKRID